MEALIQLINGIGFPAFITVLIFYRMNTLDTTYASSNDKLSEKIEENTKAIITLTERIRKDEQ